MKIGVGKAIFSLGINEITFMHVPTPSSAHHPITPLPFLSWPGMVTFCTYCYNSNSIYQYRQVTATLFSKNIMLFSLLFSRNHHYKHTVDQDQLNEWVMRKNNTSSNNASNYNCTLLTWASLQDHKKWMIWAAK